MGNIVEDLREKKQKDGRGAGYISARPRLAEIMEHLHKNTIVHMEDTWADTIHENMNHIKENGSFAHLEGSGYGKTCIVVGASPALRKNVDALHDIDGEYRDHFILFAVNSSANYLLEHGIKPDYIVAVDADEEVWTRDISKYNREDLTLLVSPFINPKIPQNWKGKLMFIPMGCPDEKVQDEVKEVLKVVAPIPGCGTAFNQAVFIAYHVFRSKNFIFVGNELSWPVGEKYYVDGKHSNDEEDIEHFPAMDIWGKKVLTTTGHWVFKIFLEELASKTSGTWINATEAGILGISPEDGALPWIKQFYLKNAIANMKENVDNSKDWRFVEQAKYHIAWQDGYDHEGSWPLNFIEGIDVKTVLEVGCGNGSGVRNLVENGYDAYGCDIVPAIAEKWNGVASRCTFAFSTELPCEDKHFDLVTTDILEHLPIDVVSDSIQEMKRAGKHLLFHLDYNKAEWQIMDEAEPHQTIRPSGWWRKEFRRNGLQIINSPNHRTFLLKEK